MSISVSTDQGPVVIPGAYAEYGTQQTNSGQATTGVIMIVGEADAGPDYSLESDLDLNAFGPDQLALVVSKYRSGAVVDAYMGAIAASNDPDIKGAPALIKIAKTNPSVKATLVINKTGGGTYGTLQDNSWGKLGNLYTSSIIAAPAEVPPTTGPLTFIPPTVASAITVRLNGGAAATVTATAAITPTAFVAAGAASGATGGIARAAAEGGGDKISIVAVGAVITIAQFEEDGTTPLNWVATPVVGDTLMVFLGGALAGAASATVGSYVVTAVTASTATATKLADKAGGTPGTVTNPASVTVVAATTADAEFYSPVVFSGAAAIVDGSGKSIEIIHTTNQVEPLFFGLGTVTPATGVYTTAPAVVAAAVATIADADFYSPAGLARASAPGAGGKMSIAVAAQVVTISSFLADGTTANNWATAPVVGDTLKIFTTGALKGTAVQGGTNWYTSGAYLVTSVTASTAVATKLSDSTAGTSPLIVSAFESGVTETLARATDNISETHTVGGDIPLQIGYLGTTATCTVGGVTGTVATTLTAGTPTQATSFVTTVTGGAGASLASVDLTTFPTINDLVNYINTFAGYTAKAGTAALGLLPCTALDQGTYTFCSSAGGLPGRIKDDGYRFFNEMLTSPSIGLQVQAPAGLPATNLKAAFTGGTRGATTQATFQLAVDALKLVDGNFVLPTFSQNATLDITAGLTDSGSTYTIDSVNAYVLAHCNAMGKIQARKNRQGFCSKRDTYANAKLAAQTLAAANCSLAFQDAIALGKLGLAQYQPWMTAAKAAGMQAAGGPKAIFNKLIAMNGVIQNANDFNSKDDAAVTAGLKAGLLIVRKRNGFRFVSDQTTYSQDTNPVWNSIQAIYAANTVALTCAGRMELAFVGKTLSQVSAAVAMSYLEAIMADQMKLGYLAQSDGAPNGFKDAKIVIVGPTMQVQASIFIATALYFVVINFQVNQVRQTATQ